MTNRERLALMIQFSDHEDKKVAEIITDAMDQIGVLLFRQDKENLSDWLALECDPETNEWGEFED